MSVALIDSPMQWLIVLLIIVLLFGASRIPDTMRNLGKGVSEFKKGLRDAEEESRREATKADTKEGDGSSKSS